ncbi:hypothetical protein MXB_3584, partial [Myxobolus squamalis]
MIHDVDLSEKERDESCLTIALFRKNLYAAILDHFYSKMVSGCTRISMTIRSGELMYFFSFDHVRSFACKPDRVIVTYSMAFTDQTDIIISKVFFQELKEGKKAGKNAPPVLVSLKDPPSEFEDLKLPNSAEAGH